MGNDHHQKHAPAPVQRDPMDVILDLRMTKKKLEADSRRALKEKEKNMAKAKQALQKNNEEGARMFLQSANNKNQEANNLMKMAMKIDYVESQVKNAQNNTQMMEQIQRITPVMQQYTQTQSLDNMYNNMTQYEQALDDIMIQGKVMDQMMNKDNSDVHQNAQIDMLMQQMRNEQQIEIQNQLGPQTNAQQQFQAPQVQQQQQFQQQPQYQQQFQQPQQQHPYPQQQAFNQNPYQN